MDFALKAMCSPWHCQLKRRGWSSRHSCNGGASMSQERPQPIRDQQGASILGPTNPPREAQAPDLLVPPRTDHGTLPSLRWSFADSHNRLEEGGWARQTTIRELPIATEIAG